MISGDLYTFLSAKASIRAIVAMDTTESPNKLSFYVHMLPQNHLGFPALTYSQDDNSHQQLLDGVSTLKEALLSVTAGLSPIRVLILWLPQ